MLIFLTFYELFTFFYSQLYNYNIINLEHPKHLQNFMK